MSNLPLKNTAENGVLPQNEKARRGVIPRSICELCDHGRREGSARRANKAGQALLAIDPAPDAIVRAHLSKASAAISTSPHARTAHAAAAFAEAALEKPAAGDAVAAATGPGSPARAGGSETTAGAW